MTPRDTWNALSYEDREMIARFIFEQITDSPCSYRKLIYGRLGFEGKSYAPLYVAGGMAITNAMHTQFKPYEPIHTAHRHIDGRGWWSRLWRAIRGERSCDCCNTSLAPQSSLPLALS